MKLLFVDTRTPVDMGLVGGDLNNQLTVIIPWAGNAHQTLASIRILPEGLGVVTVLGKFPPRSIKALMKEAPEDWEGQILSGEGLEPVALGHTV